jgi:hypothetical protein
MLFIASTTLVLLALAAPLVLRKRKPVSVAAK